MRLSDFSSFPKCDIDVITWRGIKKNFGPKVTLIRVYQKSDLKTVQFLQSTRTYKQIYYTINSRYNEVLGTCKFLRYIRIFVIIG